MTTTIRSSADGSKSYIAVGGTDRVTIGSQGIEAGSFKPGAIAANDFADGALIENAPVGIGYGPGAGGTVTQATSKSTAVTLNKPSGKITMNNATLTANSLASFLVMNSLVSVTDVVVSNHIGGGDPANYSVVVTNIGNGSFAFRVKNVSTGSLSDALELNFTIIKGATS